MSRIEGRTRLPLVLGFVLATGLVVFWRVRESGLDWPLGTLVWRLSLAEWRSLLPFGLGVVLGARAADSRGQGQQVVLGMAAALGLGGLRILDPPSWSVLRETWSVLIWLAVPVTFGFVGSQVMARGRVHDRFLTLAEFLGIVGAAAVTFRWWQYYISSHASGVSSWVQLWEARIFLLALVAVWASVKHRPFVLVVAFVLTFLPVLFDVSGARRVAASILYLAAPIVFVLEAPPGRWLRSRARGAALAGSRSVKAYLRILAGREPGPVLGKAFATASRSVAGLLGAVGVALLVASYPLWIAVYFLLVPTIFGFNIPHGLLILGGQTSLSAATLAFLWYAFKPSLRLGLWALTLSLLALGLVWVEAAILGEAYWEFWGLSDLPLRR